MPQPCYLRLSRKRFLPSTFQIALDGFVRVVMCNKLLDCYRTQENGKAVDANAYERVQLLNKNKVKLFTPVVPCRFTKADVENYYTLHCYTLNNKKEADNYLDLRCG